MIHFTLTRLDPTSPTWEAEAVCGNRRARGYTNMPEWVTCKRCKRTRLYRVTLRLTRAASPLRGVADRFLQLRERPVEEEQGLLVGDRGMTLRLTRTARAVRPS